MSYKRIYGHRLQFLLLRAKRAAIHSGVACMHEPTNERIRRPLLMTFSLDSMLLLCETCYLLQKSSVVVLAEFGPRKSR